MNKKYLKVLEQVALEALDKLDEAVDVNYLTANGQLQFADDVCSKMAELVANGKWKSKRFKFGV